MEDYRKLYTLYNQRRRVEFTATQAAIHKTVELYIRMIDYLPTGSELRKTLNQVCMSLSDTMDALTETDQIVEQFLLGDPSPLRFSHRQGKIYYMIDQSQNSRTQ